jgi:hypothetical protein
MALNKRRHKVLKGICEKKQPLEGNVFRMDDNIKMVLK